MFEIPKVETLRKWETLFIIHPDRVEERSTLFEKIKQIIQNHGGDLLKLEEWGMRKLAYPIQKKNKGYYVFAEFYGKVSLPQELETLFRIDDRVMRFIIVKLEDSFVPPTQN